MMTRLEPFPILIMVPTFNFERKEIIRMTRLFPAHSENRLNLRR